jgi:hypothetical protein
MVFAMVYTEHLMNQVDDSVQDHQGYDGTGARPEHMGNRECPPLVVGVGLVGLPIAGHPGHTANMGIVLQEIRASLCFGISRCAEVAPQRSWELRRFLLASSVLFRLAEIKQHGLERGNLASLR